MNHPCKDCPTIVSRRATRCLGCSARHVADRRAARQAAREIENAMARARHAARPKRTCLDCPATISEASAGRCTVCTNRARASAGASRIPAWLPPERAEEFEVLRTAHTVGEAERMMRDQLARERLAAARRAPKADPDRARLAAMSPFERQDELQRRGARIEERVTYRTPEPLHSLTGSSMSW